MEMGALAQAGEHEIIHGGRVFATAANGASLETAVEGDVLALETGKALFGLAGELFHEGMAAVVAEGVLEDALAVFEGFGDLEAAWEIVKGLAATGAVVEGPLFVVRLELGRNGLRRRRIRCGHERDDVTKQRLRAFHGFFLA